MRRILCTDISPDIRCVCKRGQCLWHDVLSAFSVQGGFSSGSDSHPPAIEQYNVHDIIHNHRFAQLFEHLAALRPADGVTPSAAQLESLKATMDTTPAGKQIPDIKAVVQHASLTTPLFPTLCDSTRC
jgi:hypothetical protein